MCAQYRHEKKRGGVKKSVGFSTVAMREYSLTLGTVNPYFCSSSSSSSQSSSPAPPLTLSWEYTALPVQTIDEHERARAGRPRRSTKEMKMSAGRRRAILALREDVSRDDVERVQREVRKVAERRRREELWARGCVDYFEAMSSQRRQRRLSIPPRSKVRGTWNAHLDRLAKEGFETIATLRQQAAAA